MIGKPKLRFATPTPGGINKWKINFISYERLVFAAETVEQTRSSLIDEVAVDGSMFGTAATAFRST